MNTTLSKLLYVPFFGYLFYFLGVGLISGAIVHFPIAPTRYSIILIIGVLLFLFASYVNEVYIHKNSLTITEVIHLLFFSFLLSIGIGMISGGIQHFSDIQEYATTLIPVGFAISVISFIFKNKISLQKSQFIKVFVFVLLISSALRISLTEFSSGHENPSQDSHHQEDGHNTDHGAESEHGH